VGQSSAWGYLGKQLEVRARRKGREGKGGIRERSLCEKLIRLLQRGASREGIRRTAFHGSLCTLEASQKGTGGGGESSSQRDGAEGKVKGE